MKYLFRKFLSDRSVEKSYVQAGAEFGNAVSYVYMGKCAGFEILLDTWAKWEKEYSERGYRTISLDYFIEFGGYGTDKNSMLRIKMDTNEKPVFHAERCKKIFLGKIKPKVDLERMMMDGKPQSGTYILPSTKVSAE